MRTPEIRCYASPEDYHLAIGNRADARIGSMRLKVAFSSVLVPARRLLIWGVCPAPFAKILSFPSEATHLHICRCLVPLEGRLAIVTDAGRDAVDADGAKDEGA
jgi:hypothetical protein